MYKELVKQLRSTVSRSKRTLLDDAADAIELLQKKLREERYRHDRLQDFEVAEAEYLRQMRMERNMLAEKLREKESALDLVLRDGSSCWADPKYEEPIDGESYLVIVSGHLGNIKLVNAYQLATYYRDEGWVLDTYPEMEAIKVHYWAPLPEPPEEVNYDL